MKRTQIIYIICYVDSISKTNAYISAKVCLLDTFECDDGQCIDISLYCDYILDCRDGSDEIFCGKSGHNYKVATWYYFRVVAPQEWQSHDPSS